MVEIIRDAGVIAARERGRRARDSLDNSYKKYNFSEGGFAKAKEAALEAARRNHIVAADDESKKIEDQGKPSMVSRSIDGVDNASDDAFTL